MYYKILFLSLLLLWGACSAPSSQQLADFTYKFSMESAGNFKVEFQLNPDSSYTIARNNYFFDRFEGTSRPIEKKGVLSRQEFEKFGSLLQKSNLHSMDDAYGFGENTDSENSIVYVVELVQSEKSKFVTINAGSPRNFAEAFTELID